MDDYLSVLPKMSKFPKAMQNLLFLDSFEDCEMSEEILQNVIKISQFFYNNLDYYKAHVHSSRCQDYIEKCMVKSHGERSPIPNNC